MTDKTPSYDWSFDENIPFWRLLGLKILEHTEERVLITVTTRHETSNGLGMAHGGVIATLIDVGTGMAARGPSRDNTFLTVDLQMNFLRPGTGQLTVEGRVVQRGRMLAIGSAEIRDEGGRLVARGTGTFVLRPRADATVKEEGSAK